MEDFKIEDSNIEDRLKNLLLEAKDIMVEIEHTEIEVSGIIPDTNIKQTLICKFEREEN